jgi:ATP-dependent exoDNAse (exonuclease V) beta subunit
MTPLIPRLIKASAGSGKTQEITNRYLSLILEGEAPDKILATTFTRKAAGEIKVRILERLNHAAQSENGAKELGGAVTRKGLSQQDAAKALAKLVRNSHRLRIQTLDALCIQIARSYCFEIGLDPSWKIADARSINRMNREAVQQISLTLGAPELAQKVNLISRGDAGREIHETMYEQLPMLRPFVLNTSPDVWLWLENEAEPKESNQELVALCKELKPAFNSDGNKPNANWVKALDKINNEAQKGNWTELLELTIFEKFIKNEEFNRRPFDASHEKIFSRVLKFIQALERVKARNKLRAAHELATCFNGVVSEMERAQSLLDFQGVKNLLADRVVLGDLAEMYFRLDSTIGHILLDEFQDTSISEWNVIEPIVDEILSKADTEHSLLCVGDSKQAIYGWRGGVSAIFDSITKRFSGIREDVLSTSRRSTKEVLDCVNKVFSALSSGGVLSDYPTVTSNWKDRFEEHSPADPSKGSGHVTATALVDDDEIKNNEIVSRIRNLLDKQITDDIAILVRSNRQVARYVELLKKSGVAVQEEGGQLILTSPAVSLVMAVVQLLDHPGDSASEFLIKNSPLGPEFIKSSSLTLLRTKFAEDGFGQTLSNLISEIIPMYPPRESEFLKVLAAEGYRVAAEIGSRLSAFKDFLIDTRVNLGTMAEVKVMTLHQSKGLGFDVVLLPELDDRIINSNRLPWVIPDRASALEAPDRIVPTLNKKIRAALPDFKSAYEKYESALVEESLCLLYVGMTRAKRGLHLIFTPTKVDSVPSYAQILSQIFDASVFSEDDRTPKIVFELGQELVPNKKSAPSEKHIVEIPEKVLFLKKSQRRQPTFVSPSESDSKKELTVEKLFAKRDESTRREGSEVHALLEKIDWIDCKEAALVVDQNLKVKEAAKNPQFVKTLSKEGYPAGVQLQVETELRILAKDGTDIIYGACDRVVKIFKDSNLIGLDIIDYKVTNAAASDLIERYAGQMKIYRKALSESYKLSPHKITTKILTIPTGEVIEVLPCL